MDYNFSDNQIKLIKQEGIVYFFITKKNTLQGMLLTIKGKLKLNNTVNKERSEMFYLGMFDRWRNPG